MKEIFRWRELPTYSDLLYLRLNDDLITKAQSIIYQKGGANTSDLERKEIINSVLTSFVLPAHSDEDYFRTKMNLAILKALAMRRVRQPEFRLITENYQKVERVSDLMQEFLPKKNDKVFGIIKTEAKRLMERDENFSIVVSALLQVFSETEWK